MLIEKEGTKRRILILKMEKANIEIENNYYSN